MMKSITAFCIIFFILISCQKETNNYPNLNDKEFIDKAKLYVKENLLSSDGKELELKNLNFEWEKYSITKNKSGTDILTVPITNKHQEVHIELAFLIDDIRTSKGLIKKYIGNFYDDEIELTIYTINGIVYKKGIYDNRTKKFKEDKIDPMYNIQKSNKLKALSSKTLVSKFKYKCEQDLFFNPSTNICDLRHNITNDWASPYFWTYIYSDGSVELGPDTFEIDEVEVPNPNDGGNGGNTGGNTGNTGGNGGNTGGGVPVGPGGPPQKPSETAFKNNLAYKPFSYFPNLPCDLIIKWLDIARFKVQQDQINKLNLIRTNPQILPGLNNDIVARIQSIDDAYSTIVNLDDFSVNISKMPIINGKEIAPHELIQFVRKNLNNFVSPNYGHFSPYTAYGIDDNQLWNSNNPLNSVLEIDILGPDNASVIVSDYSMVKWTFTTIFEPKYGQHPVSGNRDFGFELTDSGLVIYTRGVDRLTKPFDHLMKDVAFYAADNLWESFQTKLSNYINTNGGVSNIKDPITRRPDWVVVEQVMNGSLPLSTLSNKCP